MNGWDESGYRLGYGGGFFDRTLASLATRPIVIGVGYEIARMKTIRPQSWDVPMDWVVTERGVYRRDPGGLVFLGDPRGGEITLMALDRGQGLVHRPARQPRSGERDGDVRPPRLQLRRLPQGELVSRRQQLVSSRGHERVEERLDLGLRHRPDELVDDRPVPECLHRRDSLHAKARRQPLVRVHVDLRQHDLALPSIRGGLQRRGQGAARSTPLGPEIDHDGHLARALDDLLLEALLGHVGCHEGQVIKPVCTPPKPG